MAGQAVNSVTSAVTGEITSRVFSGLIQRYGKDAATSQKLQRLEMLLIKIHSAIEASEKRTIENSWLLRWRDKLKEAASRGDEVLARFLQLAKDAQATCNVDGNQQQGEAASSSSAAPPTPVSALSFTRKSLSGIVQGIHGARNMLLFSSVNDYMERLNRTLGLLEKLSPDIGEFIRLLHLEALPKVDQTPYSTALSTKVHGSMEKIGETREKKRMKCSDTYDSPSPKFLMCASLSPSPEEISPVFLYRSLANNDGEPPLNLLLAHELAISPFKPKGQQHMLLQDRLEAAFAEICKAIELADRHRLEDMEWLAYWADILREVKEQGWDVLSTTVNAKYNEESIVECDQEDGLSSFVHRLEGLARDAEYFKKLVHLSCILASCYYR